MSSFIHRKSKDITNGTLLEGKVFYNQFKQGYRTALEPILMAACIPAKPKQVVIEGGCGAGAGLLCLSYRVPQITGIGFERHTEMVKLANENFRLNTMTNLQAIQVTLPTLPKRPFDFLPDRQEHVDHVFANPPWHPYNTTSSPNSQKDLAKRLPEGLLSEWIHALSRPLKEGGTLTLALAAPLYAEACASMIQHRLGSITLFPLWPKSSRPPRIILLQGRMGSTGGSLVSPGLILHDKEGNYTREADLILRQGKRLILSP